MKTIPIELIDEAWDRIDGLDEGGARRLAEHFQQRQPYIMVYLLAMDEQMMAEEDRGRLMELGAVVMEVMHTVNPDLRQVTDVDLEAAEEANLRCLEKLDAGSEAESGLGMQRLFMDYNQMPLLGAILQALMTGHEENPELAPENIGLVLLYLRTVIDCLDQ